MATFASLGRIFQNMDTRTAISAAASATLIVAVLALLLFGRSLFGLDQEGVVAFLSAVQESPWAFLAVVLLFVTLALVGFPQALLFAGTVAVFGAPLGSIYAWGSTMISSAVTFFLGRSLGAPWVAKISGGRSQAMIRVVQNRGLLAAMIVRWVPSGPFIVVNAVCGAARIPYWKFAVGTGVGIIPKLALIAFFTDQIDDLFRVFTKGDASAWLAITILVLGWMAFLYFGRVVYRRVRNSDLAGLTAETMKSETQSAFAADKADDFKDKSKAG